MSLMFSSTRLARGGLGTSLTLKRTPTAEILISRSENGRIHGNAVLCEALEEEMNLHQVATRPCIRRTNHFLHYVWLPAVRIRLCPVIAELADGTLYYAVNGTAVWLLN